MCLLNGLFDKKKHKMIDHTPDIFVVGSCGYGYKPEAICPMFDAYLLTFCEGHEDRVELLRSFMRSVLYGDTSPQIFLHISGAAATGKSIYAHVLSSLLPSEAVVSTRIRDLNLDKFEVINLSLKSLIVISDVEDYTGDMSIIKAFVGQDVLKGSVKYVQGNFDVIPTGIILVIGNQPFTSDKDSGGALARRALCFTAGKPTDSRVPLIYRQSVGGYQGPL
jgi:putative DNA primase/helicase